VNLFPEAEVVPHPGAFAPDSEDVAVVQESVDQRGSYDLIAEDLVRLLEALVAGKHGGSVLVAAPYEWR